MAASARVWAGSFARDAAASSADTTAEYSCDSASLAWFDSQRLEARISSISSSRVFEKSRERDAAALSADTTAEYSCDNA